MRRVRGSAVTVVGRRTRPSETADGRGTLLMGGVGSGVVVSWRGTWVLTNYHVVDEEERVEAVTADGRSHRLQLRATDRRSDLALLSFESLPDGIVAAPIVERGARASRERARGSWRPATPSSSRSTARTWRPSASSPASGRPTRRRTSTCPRSSTTPRSTPGSSGGALWNLRGELVGINGTIATRTDRRGGGPAHTGASFSVPVSAVRAFLTPDARRRGPSAPDRGGRRRPSCVASPRPSRGRPAASACRSAPRPIAAGRPAGALVSQVAQSSPAAPRRGRAGLRAGDLVTTFSAAGRDYRIRSAADVESVMRLYPAGTPVSLQFYRAGRALAWTGRLAVR